MSAQKIEEDEEWDNLERELQQKELLEKVANDSMPMQKKQIKKKKFV